MFAQVSGDRVLGVLLSLDELVGGRRAIVTGAETVELTPVDPDSVAPNAQATVDLFERLNSERSDLLLPELTWSEALSKVAVAHANEMYAAGYFSHQSPVTGDVVDRLQAAGSVFRQAGENLALAADSVEAHDGLVGSPRHFANITESQFTSVGIAAVDGPYGLMVVQVFGG